ncbi:MAG: nucleotidyltransferase family protein [Gemmatimonadaceae bacterium]
MADLRHLLLSPDSSIRAAIAAIDRNHKGIVAIVDGERRLLGTVTDGDVRRAMLASIDLEAPVQRLLERRSEIAPPHPVTARRGTPQAALLQLMRDQRVRQLPLLDDERRVVDLVLLDDLLEQRELPVTAVVMAGGMGQRLRPLTDELPKPLLPVAGKPLMETLIEQLQRVGIRRVNVTTHYLGTKIASHFGDGERYGVEITYVEEHEPLGTAGSLTLLERRSEPLLVINGDILTNVDFGAMLAFHQDHHADMTVAVREYSMQVPYGVIECDGVEVRRITEKPRTQVFVTAGIYLLNPDVVASLPGRGERIDMPDLINRLLERGARVISFPIREYWLDIGQLDDYERAQTDVAEGKWR